jgi:hypothetical protein
MKIKLITTLIFSISSMVAFGQQVNFSGTWQIDKANSDLGSVPDTVVSAKMQVTQQSDNIVIERFFNKAKGTTSYKEKLTLSGTPSDAIKIGENTKIAQVQLNNEKLFETANLSGVIGGQAFDIQSSETWSLSADKKQLLIDRTLTQDGEKFTNHLVYEKQ